MFKSHITINEKVIGKGSRPYIIAEMACAHNGSVEAAKKLINASVNAKADAIQLQFFRAESTVTPNHEAYKILCKIEFSDYEWKELVEYSSDQGIDVFVCTYDKPSVELAVELGVDGIKLNSADLSNPEIVIGVAESGIPFTLGTGASTLEEIAEALRIAEMNGAENIVLMHGVQNFPTKNEDLNISRIELLQSVFGNIPVGYADHTVGGDSFGLYVDLIAIGLGATLLEKHITLDRSEKGIDYQAALEPEEFKKYVEVMHKGQVAYGSKNIKAFSESEIMYRKFQKKSIVAARDILKGEKIVREDVTFLRNKEPGLSPDKLAFVIGKKIIRNINRNDNLLISDLK